MKHSIFSISLLFAELAMNYVYPKIEKNLILNNLEPMIRQWKNPYAYLYNANRVRFVQYGFECILFNEHINIIMKILNVMDIMILLISLISNMDKRLSFTEK